MRHNERTPRFLAGLVALLLVSTVAWAQTPMLTDQPTEDDIQTFVSFWATSIASATEAEDVTDAADKLTRAFDAQSTSRYTFANIASTKLVEVLDALDDSDPLVDLKRVNIAMAVANMPQVASQDALQALIVDESAAVRYQGWVGYGAIRTLILSQGGSAETQFHDDIEARLIAETDPQTLNAIFDVMALPGFRPESLPADVYVETAETFLANTTAVLPACAQAAYNGDAEWIDACGSAVTTTAGLLALVQDTDPDATLDAAQLQSVLDVMTIAAEVYAQTPAEDDELLVEAETLMRECEDLLNEATGLRSTLVAVAIAEDESRETSTPLAVIAWTKQLADFGVIGTDLNSYAPASDEPEADAAE